MIVSLAHALFWLVIGMALVVLGTSLLLAGLLVRAKIAADKADGSDAEFDAYMGGYHSAVDGSATTNPFPAGPLHTEWSRGFREGVIEREDRR